MPSTTSNTQTSNSSMGVNGYSYCVVILTFRRLPDAPSHGLGGCYSTASPSTLLVSNDTRAYKRHHPMSSGLAS
ncbi:hypothetical protein VMCG_02710 [Cytospora schulzeri]|uniref:Uncharacterized protein n=1 Tax=Cytospora schulzeri TaxID=448051 RepID=A0A423WZG0_9PEZI|nr:hypothetical protein VMCG_02710 [Valsa malicola]